jgi:hypothetical protein
MIIFLKLILTCADLCHIFLMELVYNVQYINAKNALTREVIV